MGGGHFRGYLAGSNRHQGVDMETVHLLIDRPPGQKARQYLLLAPRSTQIKPSTNMRRLFSQNPLSLEIATYVVAVLVATGFTVAQWSAPLVAGAAQANLVP